MKQKFFLILLIVSMGIQTACTGKQVEAEQTTAEETPVTGRLDYQVDPVTFQLKLGIRAGSDSTENPVVTVSEPGIEREVVNFQQEGDRTSFTYPSEGVEINIQPVSDYLEVTISSMGAEDNHFLWPMVSGDVYYLPFGEGKRIPAEDGVWKDYLMDESFSVMEQLSMPFFASVPENGEVAAVYIMEQPYRSSLNFHQKNTSLEEIAFTLNHEYPQIDPEKVQRFRIYLTDPDAASIAKQYRSYVMEQGSFKTMKEKAAENPDIEKLYGAPHIYFWSDRVISEENIDWGAFHSQLSSEAMKNLVAFAGESEEGKELGTVVAQVAAQDYTDNYQKKVIIREISGLLRRKDLSRAFGGETDAMDGKNLMQIIQYNKLLLVQNLPKVFLEPVSSWADRRTVDVINEMKESGIDKAWIGLNNWEDGLGKPELVDAASQQGYLVGPYDSYHSIHQPGKEQWNTAAFPDSSLYESATVTGKDGKKIAGFQNVGRKLNPVLSLQLVKDRVDGLLNTGISFNSWFIDCDGTGEIYDDYSKDHPTTMQQDLTARLKRMEYIAKDKNMVIGTEGGNDFSAATVAFAHGLQLQSFSWMDEDMKNNKDSEYYLGRYYSADGGVPEKFGKPVPVKERYRSLFLDMSYQVPLYELVYHDSMITSYHWDWSTLKIKGEEDNRMLREMLYQVPPLYHLDREIWEDNKDVIIDHTKEWSKYHKITAAMEMTDFQRISEDGLVQMTEYGDEIKVFANFSETDHTYNNTLIPAGSYIVEE